MVTLNMKHKTLTTLILALLLVSTQMLVLNITTSTLVHATQDTTPPVLHNVWVEPSVVDAGESVTVFADFSDDLSGVSVLFVYAYGPTANQWLYFYPVYNSTSGLWEATALVPEYSETGLWTIEHIDCRDNVNNYKLYYYGIDYVADFTVCSGSVPVVDVWASDASGNAKDSFVAGTTVYGTVPEVGLDVSLYVVSADSALNDGDTLTDVSLDGVETLTLNSGQGTQTIQVWSPPTIIGNYLLVLDTNNNGIFDAELDCVDSFEIVSLSVIPEVPFGTLMVLVSMFVAVALFVGVRRSRSKTEN